MEKIIATEEQLKIIKNSEVIGGIATLQEMNQLANLKLSDLYVIRNSEHIICIITDEGYLKEANDWAYSYEDSMRKKYPNFPFDYLEEVHKLDWRTEEEKSLFKTYWEIMYGAEE